MAGTRKSARMSERRRREEEDEERKQEDYQKRQRTLFQRKDNVIRKNDLVVDTRLGKVAFVNPDEAFEDIKVKVETNDAEEEMQQLEYSKISAQHSCQETDDNNGTPISDSSQVEVKPEVHASQNTTGTNEQFEAKLTSLTLELDGMRQLVTEQNQTIVQLSTELETVKTKEQENVSQFMMELKSVRLEMESEKKEINRRFEEHERMTIAELEVFKRENRKLEASLHEVTREVEAVKMKSEEEPNFSSEDDDPPETPNPVTAQSELPCHSDEINSVTNATKASTIEDPDMEAVLSRILKYIGNDVQGLKTFRSVCRAWNQVSLSTWRNTATVSLTKDSEVKKFLMEHQNHWSPYQLADKPYSRFKLKNLLIDEGQTEVWDQFWEMIGPLMEYVHCKNSVILNTTIDTFSKLLIEKMPNLKELALSSVKYKFRRADNEMPFMGRFHWQIKSLVISGHVSIYLDRLLASFPNLESIEVTNDHKGKIIYYDTLEKISQAKILNPTSLSNLKILYVNLTCLEKRDRMKQATRHAGYDKFKEDMVETVEHVMEGVVVESLETLHIDYEFPDRSLRTLAKWAPNLRILKTIISWNNVSAVVEEWSELKELTCLFESKIRDWMISKDDTRSRRKKGAVLSDLKRLEHFQLDCLCDASKLTDAAVFYGLLKMPSLKSVQICVSKQFSDEAEKALKHRVKNCRIIRNYTGGDHSNYDCCQRREFDLEVAATGICVYSKGYVDEGVSDESEDDFDTTFNW